MLVRTAFPDLNLTTELPAIDEVIYQDFRRVPEQYSKFFNVLTSNRSIEQTTGVSGLGLFVETAEGDDVRYDDPAQRFDKTYTHLQYTSGYKVSEIAFEDDKYGYIKSLASALGRSARETVEVVAANVINNGFSDTGPDGQFLFDTDHPQVKRGSTGSNTSTAADLSQSTLESALSTMRDTVDDAGIPLRLMPKWLVVPNELEFTASVLLNTTLKPGSANNDVNSLKHRLDGFGSIRPVGWHHLTDPDAWFIFCDKEEHQLRFYWRKKFQTRHDTEFANGNLLTAGRMRFSVGYSDWYGVFGNPGA